MNHRDAMFARCDAALDALRVPADRAHWFVPGRIEVLGKHTDYAGGQSLVCAMDRGFSVVARERSDAAVRIVDVASGDARELSVDPDLDTDRGDWTTYVATVLRRLARDFPGIRSGADVAFMSDLPAASGMSSSSALVVAVFLVVEHANDILSRPDAMTALDSREALAGYLGAVESGHAFGPFAGDRGIGVFGGSEDHTAILCARPDMLSRYSFCPVRALDAVTLPTALTFIVAYSGVAAEKGGGARTRYNEASLSAARIVDLWNRATHRSDACLADAIASDHTAVDRLRGIVRGASAADTAERLADRLEQFVDESGDIVPDATVALAQGDLEVFGNLVDRSQRNAELLLGNQVPETCALQRLARELGAHAASAFGAGFGGSVWALVDTAHAGTFSDAWCAAYRSAFPGAAAAGRFMTVRPGPAASRIWHRGWTRPILS